MFTGFIFVCAFGTLQCDRTNAQQVIQAPHTYSNHVSAGLSGMPCVRGTIAYAQQLGLDKQKVKIVAKCEYTP